MYYITYNYYLFIYNLTYLSKTSQFAMVLIIYHVHFSKGKNRISAQIRFQFLFPFGFRAFNHENLFTPSYHQHNRFSNGF